MAEKSKKPAIRFAGFTDAWEQRKLGDITSLITKGTTPLDKSNLGNVNFIKIESIDESSGEITITQKITYEEHEGYLRRSQLKESDILFSIAGTLGRVASVKSNILPANTNQALAIIRLKNDELQYIKTYLKGKVVSDYIKKNPTIGAQPNLSLAQVGSLKIALPIFDEQKKIGIYFENLDNLITLHQRKYDKLVNVKKAMLEKMFPKDGADVPEIRFKGFTEAWEQRKLGEIYEVNNERNAGQYSIEKTLSIATMTFNEQGNGADVSSLSKYKVLRVGDLAFEGHTNKEFRYGRFVLNNLENGIMSPRFTTLRPIIKQDFNFWEYYIHSERVMRSKLVNATKSGTMMNELVPVDLFRQLILLPKMPEQTKIGGYFKHLDNLITLHQRKLEKLKNLKKACLEKMFV